MMESIKSVSFELWSASNSRSKFSWNRDFQKGDIMFLDYGKIEYSMMWREAEYCE